MQVRMPEHPSAERSSRRAARVCLLIALAVMAALTLARDTWPNSEAVHALFWPALASAATLLLVGRFVIGRGLDWNEPPNEEVDSRTRTYMIGVGLVLVLLFGFGRLMCDGRVAREQGGIPGLARSLGLGMSGVMLVAWAIYRPTWLFPREHGAASQHSLGDPRAWVVVYNGPTAHAMSVQLMLDQAGFRTHVPEMSTVWFEPSALTTSVLVHASDASEALSAVQSFEHQFEPRSA